MLDYSLPVSFISTTGTAKGYLPFVGVLTNEEFLDFVNNKTIKTFDEYYKQGSEQIDTGEKRRYVVGEYEIEKEQTVGGR